MEMAHLLLFLPSYGDEVGCDFCLSIISIFFLACCQWDEKIGGKCQIMIQTQNEFKHERNSNVSR